MNEIPQNKRDVLRRPFGVHVIGDIYREGAQAGLPDGRWVCAVPEPYSGGRLRAAWWVLTGRAHAIIWPKPGELEDALQIDRRSPARRWLGAQAKPGPGV